MRVSASHAARWRRACPARSPSTSRTTTRLPRTRATPFGRLPLGTSIGSRPTIARVIPPHKELVAELAELIAIPSVSADPAHAGDLQRAAEWVAERIRGAGGTVEIREREGRPFVAGEVPASNGDG